MARTLIPLWQNWQFAENFTEQYIQTHCDETHFTEVQLPHTVKELPYHYFDEKVYLEARTFLKELQRDLGVTSVFVTHDQAEALALADRIAVMRQGRIQQVGTPGEVFHGPANEFVASFIGSHPMNLNDGAQ